MKSFVVIDSHPEGSDRWLTEPTSLHNIAAFGTEEDVRRLMNLKVGEVYEHQFGIYCGIKRVS